MQKIVFQSGQALQLRRPNILKSEYELRAGDAVVATLRFRSELGTLATAESADGCWTFKRVGAFQTHITVRACDTEVDLAVFNNNTWKNGGTLVLTDGRTYPVSTNFWETELDFKSADDAPVLRFKNQWGLRHQSAEVEILPAGEDLPELPWMILLGWYLAVMSQHDATNTALFAALASMM